MKRKRVTEEKWPSVTQIVDIAGDKTGLLMWYGKNGTVECNRVKRESAGFGSAVHDHVAKVLKQEESQKPTGRIGECAQMLLQWCDEAKVKPVEVEVELISKQHRYVGHPDAIVTFGDDQTLWCLDWKSSNRISDSYGLQLSGYALAYEEMTGRRVDHGAILRVAKDPNAKQQFEAREYHNLIEDYGPLFLHCRELWDYYHSKGKWTKVK